MVSKKKPKAVVKREEASIKDGEKEDGDGQTQGETLQERENSQIKSKPKSRKRRNSHEEDVIDGFLMVSYASLEDLEVCYYVYWLEMSMSAFAGCSFTRLLGSTKLKPIIVISSC